MESKLGSSRVEVGGYDLHYLHSTAAPQHALPTVVLVHGLGVSSRNMEPAARCIGARFPVLVPDLPGYGRSPRPWEVYGVEDLAGYLLGFCEAVGVESAVFVSLSFGCQIVIDLAALAPELVEGLLLIGPTIDVDARTAPEQVLRLVLDAPLEPPSLFPVILRDYLEFGLRRGAITLWHALADDVLDKLPRVTAPVLVTRGEMDTVVPRSWCMRVVAELPDARYAEIPGAAHGANFSHPEALALLLESFLLRRGLIGGDCETARP